MPHVPKGELTRAFERAVNLKGRPAPAHRPAAAPGQHAAVAILRRAEAEAVALSLKGNQLIWRALSGRPASQRLLAQLENYREEVVTALKRRREYGALIASLPADATAH